MIRSLCVFCGSNSGNDAAYANVARDFGALLATSNIALVYGGGHVGLMGIVADAVLAGGGNAIGVIPRMLWDREVGHRNLTELHVVETMHERKAMMASLSDAFVALAGGLGTLEEIFEVWTWAQLGIHRKPLGFLDVLGFYEPLLSFLDARSMRDSSARSIDRWRLSMMILRRYCGVCRSTNRRLWRSGSAQRIRSSRLDSIAVSAVAKAQTRVSVPHHPALRDSPAIRQDQCGTDTLVCAAARAV